ncbi:hypothetical protein VNO80_13348 [Phaseolus coccineus]|uniref:Prolamin-like domain-containing protein n=1 Tax=Phaseolus coccineus TaxID=3886 RepID=A0AAN9R9W8_PHACN
MASFNSFCVAVFFLISFNLSIEKLAASEILLPSKNPSSSRVNYAPRPLSPYATYLSNCVKELKPKCGEQIFFAVIVGNQTVSNYCCLSLVNDMGKTCHNDVTSYAANLPEYKKNKTQILNRCEKIWNYCSSLGSPPYV